MKFLQGFQEDWGVLSRGSIEQYRERPQPKPESIHGITDSIFMLATGDICYII